MKRSCLISLLLWAALAAGFYFLYHGRFSPPADRWGAIAAGFFTALGIGALRTAMQSAADARRVSAAIYGETSAAPEDGKTMAAYGSILPLGKPLESPFTHRKAVVYSYEIEHERSSSDGTTTVKDYSGLALTPCAISTPYGPIRLLGFPQLEGFGKEYVSELDNARQYIAQTQFEEMKGLNVGAIYHAVKDVITEADGDLRKDWCIGRVEELDEDHTLREEVVPAGEQVCAIGMYSSADNGLIPSRSDGTPPRLVRGDPNAVAGTLRKKMVSGIITGLFVTLVANGIIFFVLTMRQRSPEVQQHNAEEIFDATRDGDVARLGKLLDDGLNVNVRDSSGSTPLAEAPDGRTAAFLIAHGADVNAADNDGKTVLMNQTEQDHADVVEELIKAKASLDVRHPKWHTTALDRALDTEHLGVAQLLRDAGAKDQTVTAKTGSPVDDEHAAVTVCREYLRNVQAENRSALEALSTFGSLADVDFKIWKASRPVDPDLVTAFANEDNATVVLRGMNPAGENTTWTYQVVRRDGVWKVSGERWESRLEGK